MNCRDKLVDLSQNLIDRGFIEHEDLITLLIAFLSCAEVEEIIERLQEYE